MSQAVARGRAGRLWTYAEKLLLLVDIKKKVKTKKKSRKKYLVKSLARHR